MRSSHPHLRPGVAALVATALLLTAACGSSDDDTGGPATTVAGSASAGRGDLLLEDSSPAIVESKVAPADRFPVTVDHELGSTTIDAPPERIVVVGYTEQDTLLALGIVPIATTEWYGEMPSAVWPWAQDELGDHEPEVLHTTDGFEYERIATFEPDLIIGTNAGIDETSYASLSKIAPTVAHPEGQPAYFSPWDDQTRLVGEAVGFGPEAEKLVTDIEARFAEARADHPGWKGEQAVLLQNAFYDGAAIAYQDGLSTAFLTDLGFAIPDELERFRSTEDYTQAHIPIEQLPVLDAADVLLWATEDADDAKELEKVSIFRGLEEVENGDVIYTDGLTAGAIYFTSPLSLPYVLARLVPALEQVFDGDGPVQLELPTTTGEPSS